MALRRSTTSSSRSPEVSVLSMIRCRSLLRGKILGAEAVKHVRCRAMTFGEVVAAVARHDGPALTLRTRVAARSAVCVRVAFSLVCSIKMFNSCSWLMTSFALIGRVSLHLYGHDV